MLRVHLLLVLGLLVAWAAASSAPTFCKCTCFKNSTIIVLGPQTSTQFVDSHRPASSPSSSSTSSSASNAFLSPLLAGRSASASCAQCTKAFCLDNRIPFCADATEADVATLCFQRDSYKDRLIVWGFMLCLAGLLGAAALRRGLEWRRRAAALPAGLDEGRGCYSALAGDGTPAMN